jgi:hypothetical protein
MLYAPAYSGYSRALSATATATVRQLYYSPKSFGRGKKDKGPHIIHITIRDGCYVLSSLVLILM